MDPPLPRGPGSLTSSIARVVGAYAIFASLWILLSDRALELFFPDRASYTAFSTIKGFAFVAVTATLLWLLLRVELGRRARAEEALAQTTAHLQRAQQIAHVGHWAWTAPEGGSTARTSSTGCSPSMPRCPPTSSWRACWPPSIPTIGR